MSDWFEGMRVASYAFAFRCRETQRDAMPPPPRFSEAELIEIEQRACLLLQDKGSVEATVEDVFRLVEAIRRVRVKG